MTERSEPHPRACPEERRQYVRLRKEVRLTCHLMEESNKAVDISTRNLSVGGLLITLRREVKPGAMLNLRFAMEEGRVEVMVPARVVWADYNGISGQFEAGVALVGIDPLHRRNILSLRRHYSRLPRRLFVEYRPSRGVLRRWRAGHTRDISVGGLGLTVPKPMKPGRGLDLRIHFDDGSGDPVPAEGTVLELRDSDEPGGGRLAAVRFDSMDDASRRRLASYISRELNAEVILPGKGVRVWKKRAAPGKKSGADAAE
jgi:c-di-GMP-binding flagellar brake protein YcgR